MGWRQPFGLAAVLATLCAPVAMPAGAQAGWEYCVALDEKEYCMPMVLADPLPHPWFPGSVVAEPAPLPWFPGLVLADPVPLPWFPGWPIDPGPLRSIDASRITPGLRDLVRGDATHLFVTDSLGQSLLVIDVKGGVAFDLNQNLAR